MAAEPANPSAQTTSLATDTPAAAPPSEEVSAYVVEQITDRFEKAKKPVVLVDACAGRFGMAGEVRKLVEGCGIRFFESTSPNHSYDAVVSRERR